MLAFLLRDIDPEKWRQFKSRVALSGRTIRDVVLSLVYDVATGKIRIDRKDKP